MNKTILIIDDDDDFRTSLAKGLRAHDFDVILANSAESGAQILTRIAPDAVVLDRMMRGTDGLTALAAWRAAGIDVPVIMLTALSGTQNTIDGLSTGADDYLAKPFQLRELVLRLNNIMQRRGAAARPAMPDGLIYADGEFFVSDGSALRLLPLSTAEKNFLLELVNPVGNIAMTAPMVAKRVRAKLTVALPGVDLVTVRGKGYKLINIKE